MFGPVSRQTPPPRRQVAVVRHEGRAAGPAQRRLHHRVAAGADAELRPRPRMAGRHQPPPAASSARRRRGRPAPPAARAAAAMPGAAPGTVPQVPHHRRLAPRRLVPRVAQAAVQVRPGFAGEAVGVGHGLAVDGVRRAGAARLPQQLLPGRGGDLGQVAELLVVADLQAGDAPGLGEVHLQRQDRPARRRPAGGAARPVRRRSPGPIAPPSSNRAGSPSARARVQLRAGGRCGTSACAAGPAGAAPAARLRIRQGGLHCSARSSPSRNAARSRGRDALHRQAPQGAGHVGRALQRRPAARRGPRVRRAARTPRRAAPRSAPGRPAAPPAATPAPAPRPPSASGPPRPAGSPSRPAPPAGCRASGGWRRPSAASPSPPRGSGGRQPRQGAAAGGAHVVERHGQRARLALREAAEGGQAGHPPRLGRAALRVPRGRRLPHEAAERPARRSASEAGGRQHLRRLQPRQQGAEVGGRQALRAGAAGRDVQPGRAHPVRPVRRQRQQPGGARPPPAAPPPSRVAGRDDAAPPPAAPRAALRALACSGVSICSQTATRKPRRISRAR